MNEQVNTAPALDIAYANFHNAAMGIVNDLASGLKENILSTNLTNWFTEEESSEESEKKEAIEPEAAVAPDKTESAKTVEDIFKELLTVCGSIAQSSPATTETVTKIKDLFTEINDLKDTVEQTKRDLVEARVTGGPATPMM